MKKTDSKKLDQIIAMLGDVVEIFGKRFDKIDDRFDKIDKRFEKVDERFDKIDDEVTAVKGKVVGIYRTLSEDAMRSRDYQLPRRMHNVGVKVFGASRHPKSLPF